MQALDVFLANHTILKSEELLQAGSNRSYTRLYTSSGNFILCKNAHVAENNTFFYFAEIFASINAPVPKLIAINEERTQYIQTDGGSQDLLQTTLQLGYTDQVRRLYEEALKALCNLQIKAHANIDYTKCFAAQQFDRYAVQADLNYFKYYFLDLLNLSYNKTILQKEFERWSDYCGAIEPTSFMYRDFQGRNILVNDQQLTFIDFQGGMQGPPHYDVASLLWQAKAALPITWKKELLDYYIAALSVHTPLDEFVFKHNFSRILLTRLLQVLGAYGLRGIIEKRPHFLSSIPYGLEHLKQWLSLYTLDDFPEMTSILEQLIQPEIKAQFQ